MNLTVRNVLTPLNTELNPICHLPALLEARHILHVNKIRVKTVMFLRLFVWKLLFRFILVFDHTDFIFFFLSGVYSHFYPSFLVAWQQRATSNEAEKN